MARDRSPFVTYPVLATVLSGVLATGGAGLKYLFDQHAAAERAALQAHIQAEHEAFELMQTSQIRTERKLDALILQSGGHFPNGAPPLPPDRTDSAKDVPVRVVPGLSRRTPP